MARPVFRKASSAARQESWLGEPQAVSGRIGTFVAVMSLLLFVGFAALVLLGSYTRRESLTGVIVPANGMIQILAPTRGRIGETALTEGESVQSGATLFQLTPEADIADGDHALIAALLNDRVALIDADIAAIDTRRAADRERIETRIAAGQREIALLEGLIAQSDELENVLAEAVQRDWDLSEGGLAAPNGLAQSLQALAAKRVTLQSLRREFVAVENAIDEARVELRNLDAEYDATANRLALQRNEVLRQIAESAGGRPIDILAPESGRIALIPDRGGRVVEAGDLLATVLPEDFAPQIEILAPSRTAVRLEVGTKVTLRYAAFPYRKYGHYEGAVVSVSETALAQDVAGGVEPKSGSVFKVVVRPDQPYVSLEGRDYPLSPGIEVDAKVPIETRRLYQWLTG